jgi:Flp pilus assembly protein CpaB
VLIAIVVILAFVLNLLVLQDRSATTLVAVANQRLVAGTPIDASSFRLVTVDSGFDGLSDLVTDEELAALEGWVLSRSIAEGGLIDHTALVEPGAGAGLRSMSLPVPVEHAAGGALVEGDRVDVISVIDGNAAFVAADLEVVAVSENPSGAIGSIGEYHVVVSVTADAALDLAAALDAGSVEIVRSTGAETIDPRRDDGP